jgi:cyanophycinase
MSLRLLPCAVLLALPLPGLRAADPLPAALDPRGVPGPLVIAAGQTEPKDALQAFFELAGKDRAKIVVLLSPIKRTADPKLFLAPWVERKPASADLLWTKDRKEADDPKFAKPLTEATGVWIEGADAAHFHTTYRGTLVEKEMKKLHARGGVIGGGYSGAVLEELGLLPGFTAEPASPGPGYVGFTFRDDSAIVIRDRVARVLGDEPITVRIGKGAGRSEVNDEYKAGSLLDLVQLQRAALNRAAKDPFPPAKPADPVVAKGALVIVGGGGADQSVWKRFIELAGGPDATIVFVPTALDKPLAVESAEEKALKKYGARHVVALHTRDRKEADDPKFSAVLTKATGVWFSGGRQWRFVDSYEGTLTEKRFRAVLARGGVIGGSSAGASIQSEYMPRGHPLGNTVMAAEGYERGFAFLPGCAVDQHFFARKRTADMTGLMKEYPQYLGIGIDESTALVVTGSTAEVIGKSKVAFYDTKKKPTDTQDYEEVFPNEKYDLKARRRINKQ